MGQPLFRKVGENKVEIPLNNIGYVFGVAPPGMIFGLFVGSKAFSNG